MADETRTPGYRGAAKAIREAAMDGRQSLSLGWYSTLRQLPPDIASLSWLKRLNLNGSPVRDLAPIAGFSELEQLDITGSQVGDAGPLAHLTSLSDAAVRATQSSGSAAGLSRQNTPLASLRPFSILVGLGQPARTVETINEVRRQQGLPAHIPKGYEPRHYAGLLESITDFRRRARMAESTFGRRALGDGAFVSHLRNVAQITPEAFQRVVAFLSSPDVEPAAPLRPRIPDSASAAIEPILSKGRISLPLDLAASDLSEDTRDAALSALKSDLGELATDIEGEANIDRRAAKLLRDVEALVPQTGPPQDVLFRLAHREEVLVAYAPTVNKEWPEILASRYHIVCRLFDRTMRQFPKWREFKRNAAKDRLSPEQLAEVPPIARETIDALADKGTEPFVDPNIPQSLEELAAPLRPQQDARDVLEISKELLVEDVVESINNVLKRVAEIALAAGLTGKQAAERYAEGLARGLVDAAKKQGPKDGAALLKWARRFLIAGGGTAAAGAFIQRLIQTFPEKFAWLEAVIRFLAQ